MPSSLEAKAGSSPEVSCSIQPGQHGETPSLLKLRKISWDVVGADNPTWEAEPGELLEPRRQRLQSSRIAPLHSRLGNESKTPSQKKSCDNNAISVAGLLKGLYKLQYKLICRP